MLFYVSDLPPVRCDLNPACRRRPRRRTCARRPRLSWRRAAGPAPAASSTSLLFRVRAAFLRRCVEGGRAWLPGGEEMRVPWQDSSMPGQLKVPCIAGSLNRRPRARRRRARQRGAGQLLDGQDGGGGAHQGGGQGVVSAAWGCSEWGVHGEAVVASASCRQQAAGRAPAAPRPHAALPSGRPSLRCAGAPLTSAATR